MSISDIHRFTPDGEETLLPYAGPSVPAGFPDPSQDYFRGEIDLNEVLIRDRANTFLVRVSGHSMQNIGICHDDEVIVDRGLTPQHGNIVVAIVDGEMTIKRLTFTAAGVVLKAENADYPDIHVGGLSDFTVWGVVTRCLHRL